MNELAARLRTFIDETFLFGANTEYGDNDSLMEHGIIDSTGVLELIAHLEAIFGLKVQDEDLIPENLDSIDGLTRFIRQKQGACHDFNTHQTGVYS
ncbi:MAG: acyl carrier protein [Planctomycetota bacterium]